MRLNSHPQSNTERLHRLPWPRCGLIPCWPANPRANSSGTFRIVRHGERNLRTYAGTLSLNPGTYRIRFAETDNVFFFNLGVETPFLRVFLFLPGRSGWLHWSPVAGSRDRQRSCTNVRTTVVSVRGAPSRFFHRPVGRQIVFAFSIASSLCGSHSTKNEICN